MNEDILILFLIVIIAASLQASTGYGFSIIGTPFLLIILPFHEAIQINIILSICLSAVMIYQIRREVDTDLMKKLIKGSIAGLIAGLLLYLFMDTSVLTLTVGIMILILTVMLISNFTIKRSPQKDYTAGGLSGLLTTSIGVPGPPLLLYFAGAKIDKTVLRSTTLAFYLFTYTASLLMQITFGGTNTEIWKMSLLALPALFIGVVIGQLIFKKISQELFLYITYVILILTGIYLIVTSI